MDIFMKVIAMFKATIVYTDNTGDIPHVLFVLSA